MASLFKDPSKLSAYRDRRFHGTKEEYEEALQALTTVYIGNMSFYTDVVVLCGPCVSYMLRKRALYNDMSRYICCAGYMPCSGRCGESRCPEFCLATEAAMESLKDQPLPEDLCCCQI